MHYCPDVSYPLVSRILHHFYLSSLFSHTCTCQLFYTPNKVATACLQTDKTESRQPFLASKLGVSTYASFRYDHKIFAFYGHIML
jgi:hypothetical protein